MDLPRPTHIWVPGRFRASHAAWVDYSRGSGDFASAGAPKRHRMVHPGIPIQGKPCLPASPRHPSFARRHHRAESVAWIASCPVSLSCGSPSGASSPCWNHYVKHGRAKGAVPASRDVRKAGKEKDWNSSTSTTP